MWWYILVLAVLGTVGGQTQGLVSHELLGAGVDGGSDGDTKDNTEREQLRRDLLKSAQALGDGVSGLAFLGSREGIGPSRLHPQDTRRVHGGFWGSEKLVVESTSEAGGMRKVEVRDVVTELCRSKWL